MLLGQAIYVLGRLQIMKVALYPGGAAVDRGCAR